MLIKMNTKKYFESKNHKEINALYYDLNYCNLVIVALLVKYVVLVIL